MIESHVYIGLFNILRKCCFVLFLVILNSDQGSSQITEKDEFEEEALKVFVDCNFCDLDFIRKNISYVNYVRDTRVAQVHVLTTTQRTGSGSTQYTFNFIGQLDFEGQENVLSTIANVDATSDERRKMRTKFIEIGLMHFVAQTPMVKHLLIDYELSGDSVKTEEIRDKWNNWVYKIRANGWFNGQAVYKSKDLSSSISANKITDKWKFENWANFNYDESIYELDSVTEIMNSNRNFYFESSAIRSINNHWSAGLVVAARSSTYRNIQFNQRISPALEYNIYDYADFNSKQIRLQYRVSYNKFQYVDTTIYNQLNEDLLSHNLSLAAEFKQKWGSINFSTTVSQYLHDTSLKRLDLWGSVSWRVAKGLSLNANGGLEFIQDQISLPKGGATDVEILTQQRQLATNYSYRGSIGFTYTFGSIYNNVVNPRFGN